LKDVLEEDIAAQRAAIGAFTEDIASLMRAKARRPRGPWKGKPHA
jgi:hypothetical protein